MSTFNGLYIRKPATVAAARTAILNLYPQARVEVLPDFVSGILPRDAGVPPEKKLAALSAQLATDVMWITYQTTAGSFIFHHWHAGQPLRALWYGCANEGVWERADGPAEPWEAAEFWSVEALAEALEDAESAAARRELERLWPEQKIRPGQAVPDISCEDAAQAAMAHYGLFSPESTTPSTAPPAAVRAPRRPGWSCALTILVWVAVAVFVIVKIIQRFQ